MVPSVSDDTFVKEDRTVRRRLVECSDYRIDADFNLNVSRYSRPGDTSRKRESVSIHPTSGAYNTQFSTLPKQSPGDNFLRTCMSTPFKILVPSDARRLIPVKLVVENVHTHVQRRAGRLFDFQRSLLYRRDTNTAEVRRARPLFEMINLFMSRAWPFGLNNTTISRISVSFMM